SVEWTVNGALYVGAGREGRIYRVDPNRTSATWIDVDERQVMAIDLEGREPIFLTADTGAAYRVLPRAPTAPLWTSKVLDARVFSQWGRLTWRGIGALEFLTQSGNTAIPDPTWTDWAKPNPATNLIQSSPGRFLRIRAQFPRDANAILYAVSAY